MNDKFEKALYDKLQFRLGKNGITPNTFKYARKEVKDLIKNNRLLCPFCLEIFHLSDFIYINSLYKCKNCNNRITGKTLEIVFKLLCCEKPDIEGFAKWVYGYRLNGFFQKINFEKWNKNLHFLGFSYEFWDYYKKLKGENKKEYEDE